MGSVEEYQAPERGLPSPPGQQEDEDEMWEELHFEMSNNYPNLDMEDVCPPGRGEFTPVAGLRAMVTGDSRVSSMRSAAQRVREMYDEVSNFPLQPNQPREVSVEETREHDKKCMKGLAWSENEVAMPQNAARSFDEVVRRAGETGEPKPWKYLPAKCMLELSKRPWFMVDDPELQEWAREAFTRAGRGMSRGIVVPVLAVRVLESHVQVVRV